MSGALFLLYHSVNSFNFGKRQIHRVKETCEFCNSIAELESYNTTSFFTFCLVPLIPLKSMRILSQCSQCRESRRLSLKEWKKRKTDQLHPLLERLQLHPNDSETLLKAIDTAILYQDEALLDKLANEPSTPLRANSEVAARIGKAHEHFSRWEDAEDAYRDALKNSDSLDQRERLALCLMKQGRSSEAVPYLRHIFEANDRHKAWLTFWLIEGFMQEGQFDSAAKFANLRDKMYPSFAKVKDYTSQRALIEKHTESEKPYRSKILSESRKVGTRKGSLLGVAWPRLLVPGFILTLLAMFVLASIGKGSRRPVYLVNGLHQPYSVTIDHQTFALQPQTPQIIHVREGTLQIDWEGNTQGPQEATIKTSFWERPFSSRIYVLNPDRSAIFESDTFAYENLTLVRYQQATQIKTGQLLHFFDHINHPFEDAPMTLQGDARYPTSRSRLGIKSVRDTQDRIDTLKKNLKPEQLRKEIAQVVDRDPDDAFALEWLVGQLPPQEALRLLDKGMPVRPLRLCWHQSYQRLIARQQPQVDLIGKYRKLVEETKRSPQSLYLLSRLENVVVRETLLREAAEGPNALPEACLDLGGMYLSRSEFQSACGWSEKACRLANRRSPYLDNYLTSLLAAKEFSKVLQETQNEITTPAGYRRFIHHRLAAHNALVGRPGIEIEIIRFLQTSFGSMPHPSIPLLKKQFKIETHLLEENQPAFLTEAAGNPTFIAAVHLLQKDLKLATTVFEPTQFTESNDRLWEVEAIWRGLFFLAASKANNNQLANQQMELLTKALTQGDVEARQAGDMLSGKTPFDPKQILQSFQAPHLKRVLLAVFARKFPKQAHGLVELSEKLNFQRDQVSLCLKQAK